MNSSLEHLLARMRNIPEAQPREEFVRNARIRILNRTAREPTAIRTTFFPRWFFALKLAAIVVVIVLFTGTGVVYAAQSSLPGTALYSIKIASEDAALRLAPTKTTKTSVAATMIDRRAEEVKELKTYGSKKDIDQAKIEYRTIVGKVRKEPQLDQSIIESHVREHERILEDSLKEPTSTENRDQKDQKSDELPKTETEMKSEGSLVPTVHPTLMPTPTATRTPATTPQRETREILGTHATETPKAEGEQDHAEKE